MPKNIYENYVRHLDSIIKMYADAPKDNGFLYDDDANGVLARAESAINKICGKDSAYTSRIGAILDGAYADGCRAELVVGIVRALRSDLEDGYLSSFPELVRGEMFGSFIEMADHLAEEGYKDAAAVIAGAALESHLRQLANKYGVSVGTQQRMVASGRKERSN